MSRLRRIVSPILPDISAVEDAMKLVGKTISKVEYGYGEHEPDNHETEVLILEFTDGTKVAISIGSNAIEFKELVNPENLKVDFMFYWNDE